MTTRLSCTQTPLAWPSTVALADLPVSTGSVILLDSPQPGSLQVTTRRQGAGDGVNIDESRSSVAVDYRGQRYTLIETIFHTPGMHVFPGQSDVYPAEYHIHLQTLAAPQRKLTIVLPLSHLITDGPGLDYFAAVTAQPEPASLQSNPTLRSLFAPQPLDVVQYLAPDLRGRTSADPFPDGGDCDKNTTASPMECMMALVLRPCRIRATDLERIPREGSLSSDPRDLPVQPQLKASETVSRITLLNTAVLSRPGLQLIGTGGSAATSVATDPSGHTELACYPLEVRNGNDVIVVDGSGIPVNNLLVGGGGGSNGGGSNGGGSNTNSLRATLFGEKETDERTAKETFWIAVAANVFLGAAVWIIFRLLLFKESQTPMRSTITRWGWLVILLSAIVAAFST